MDYGTESRKKRGERRKEGGAQERCLYRVREREREREGLWLIIKA